MLCKEIGINENSTMVELGSAMGNSTNTFSLLVKNIYCVDSWCGEDSEYDETLFDKLTELRPNICKFKGTTDTLHHLFNDEFFDLVYIDGDHSYSGVMKDILYWLPKVKQGGYIGGHDYVPNDTRDRLERSKTNGDVFEVLDDVFKYSGPNIDMNWYIKVDYSNQYISKVLSSSPYRHSI
jgi:hypothetical protein